MNRMETKENWREGKQGRKKTHSVIGQQRIHNPVHIRRVPNKMDDPILDRNDDNLILAEVCQSGSHKTEMGAERK